MLAARTKRLVDKATKLTGGEGQERRTSRVGSWRSRLQSAKLKVDEESKTQYLLFLPRRHRAGARRSGSHPLGRARGAAVPEGAPAEEGAKKKTKSAEKKAAKDAVPKEVAKLIEQTLEDSTKTPDLALFGRHDRRQPGLERRCGLPGRARAVDQPREHRVRLLHGGRRLQAGRQPGLRHDGHGRLPVVVLLPLREPRRGRAGQEPRCGDGEDANGLKGRTIEAFLRASALAIPTGKQNSMAAQNRPSYLLALVRRSGTPQSLANAFVKPVRPHGDQSLIEASVEEIEKYLDRSHGLWGDDAKAFACSDVDVTASTKPTRVKTFDSWVSDVVKAAEAHE